MDMRATLFAVIFSTPAAVLAVAGAVAAAPVIIHLLNRKRFVVMPWAAMRFLLSAQKRNVRRLRLEQWLLLSVRVLVGVLIVAAMAAIMPWAQPFWSKLTPGAGGVKDAAGRTHRVIVIDGSFSMGTRLDGQGDRFGRAKEQARAILEHSAPGDGFSLIFLGSTAQAIVSGPADDRRRVADEIEELELPHGGADVAGGLRLALEAVSRPQSKYQRREVVFITDMKRSSWTLASSASAPAGQGSSTATLAELGNFASIVFIDVAQRDLNNISVSDLTLGDPLPLAGVNTSASVVVQNHGRREEQAVPVALRVGRAPLSGERLVLRDVGQQLVMIKANASVTVSFKLENQNCFREAGDYIVQVRAGDDDLRLDNVRNLAVTVRNTIPVLVVDGKISADPLDTPGEWVRQALRPTGADGQTFESAALPTVISAAQFADRFQADLTRYDCVFLCDLPSISLSEAERLDAYLRRGGSLFISLGPNAAQDQEEYNRYLYADGKGILPGKMLGVREASGNEYFSLFAEEEAFKQAPLSAYRAERERAALTLPQFHRYVQLHAPASGPARRILSFLPTNTPHSEAGASPLDPAVIELSRHRGRVVIYTSAINPERIGRDKVWSNWAAHPTFLPFLHETLRHIVATGGRRNLISGEGIEEYLPLSSAGLKAVLIRGDGATETEVETAEVVSKSDSAVVNFARTELSGIYRVVTSSRPGALFAVNVPVLAPGGGPESDLRRLTRDDLQAAAPDAELQVVSDVGDAKTRASASQSASSLGDAAGVSDTQGSGVAWVLLSIAYGLMLLEVFLAWRLGSARASTSASAASAGRGAGLAFLGWLLPALGGLILLGTWAHAMITDDFLGYLPAAWRRGLERMLDVPQAGPGEGTRWRLKSIPYITGGWKTDRWLVGALALLSVAYVGFIYGRERIGAVAGSRQPRLGPALLRILLLLTTLLILMPQLQLLFEREAWPDLVIIFDDSRSMASVEAFSDPLFKDEAERLKLAWEDLAKPRIERLNRIVAQVKSQLHRQQTPAATTKLQEQLGSLERRLEDLRAFHRLNLVKALLASGSENWLQTLLRERKMRVHLYRASSDITRVAEIGDAEQCQTMLDEIIDIVPDGPSSRLGDAVNAVVKTFRGKSLTAVVMFTDGQNTNGEEPSQAALLAQRKKIPLYFVGVGDAAPRPDIIVGDLRAEREINVKDRLVFDVRITFQGPGLPTQAPVYLNEIVDGKAVRRDSVNASASDKPVRLTYVPETPGDKTFVVEVPVQDGESDPRNNRIEHEVHVAELKRVRVLMVDSVPRYEFRFIKTLFERESAAGAGDKSVELNVFLTGASPEFYREDHSALAEFPGWDMLRTYDVIILGDVGSKQFPRDQAQVKLIADFVKERGGGLLMIAGQHFSPRAYAGTELADILPVTTEGIAPPAEPRVDDPPITHAYQPVLTTVGQNHPIFRFASDEVENAALWTRLKPLYWYAKGYRRKLSAEVLATHPEQLAEGGQGRGAEELHPLVLQQFVGAGRVMFFGFDETWRWRMRSDEMRFNQFWLQTIRSLARSRVGRIEVMVPARTFRRDDPIRLTVRFPEDAPAPPPSEPVQVAIERRPLNRDMQSPAASDEPEVQQIQLAYKEHTRATFEAVLTSAIEGEYRFILQNPVVAGRPPKTEATVLPPRGELEDTRLNEADLKKAAAETGGEYLTLDRARELLDLIPDSPRIALDQPCPPLPIWNQWYVFTLVILFMLAEWLLRKRLRLL